MLKSKIHSATVTQCDLHYEGSISVDPDLYAAANMLPYEQVDVVNVNNGARFTTYIIDGERGSKEIQVNGAAARLTQPGDTIIIFAYAQMSEDDAKAYEPKIVILGEGNEIKI